MCARLAAADAACPAFCLRWRPCGGLCCVACAARCDVCGAWVWRCAVPGAVVLCVRVWCVVSLRFVWTTFLHLGRAIYAYMGCDSVGVMVRVPP